MKKSYYLLILLLNSVFLFSQVGIKTTDPKTTLDINGDLTIRKTESLKGTGVKSLYIDKNGLVGLAPESTDVTSEVFSAIANGNTNISGTNSAQIGTFNAGGENWISLAQSFIQLNNLDITNNGDHYVFGKDGTYLINLAVNFKVTVANANEAYILASLKLKAPGESWQTIMANRELVKNGGYVEVNKPIVFPTKIMQIKKGSELRLVFTKSRAADGSLQGSNLTYLAVTSNQSYGFDGVTLMINKL